MSNAPDWVTLTEGESVVWRGRPTLHSYVGQLLPGAVLLVVGAAAVILSQGSFELGGMDLTTVVLAAGALFALVGVLGILQGLVAWWSIQYLLTTDEVYKKRGFLSRTVTNVRLDQIQNTTFTQTFLGRVLSYGTVHIDTAGTGGTEVVFERVPNPQKVVGRITRELDRLRTDGGGTR